MSTRPDFSEGRDSRPVSNGSAFGATGIESGPPPRGKVVSPDDSTHLSLPPTNPSSYTAIARLRSDAYGSAGVFGALAGTASERYASRLDFSGAEDALDRNLEVLEGMDTEQRGFSDSATTLATFAGGLDRPLVERADLYPPAVDLVNQTGDKIARTRDLVAGRPALAGALKPEVIAEQERTERVLVALPTQIPRLAAALEAQTAEQYAPATQPATVVDGEPVAAGTVVDSVRLTKDARPPSAPVMPNAGAPEASADADHNSDHGQGSGTTETPGDEASSGLVPLSEVKLMPQCQRVVEALRERPMTPEELADAIVTPSTDISNGAVQRGGAAISVARAVLERRAADHRIIRLEDGRYVLTPVTPEDVADVPTITPRPGGVGLESSYQEERDATRIKIYVDEFGPAHRTPLRESLGLAPDRLDKALGWLEDDKVLHITHSEKLGAGGKPTELIGIRSHGEVLLEAFAAGATTLEGVGQRTGLTGEHLQAAFDGLYQAGVIEATERVTDPETKKPVYIFGIAAPEDGGDVPATVSEIVKVSTLDSDAPVGVPAVDAPTDGSGSADTVTAGEVAAPATETVPSEPPEAASPVPAETAKAGPKLLEKFTHEGETIDGNAGAILVSLDPFGAGKVVKESDIIAAVNGTSAYDLRGMRDARSWLQEHGLDTRIINHTSREQRGRIVEAVVAPRAEITLVGEHVSANGERFTIGESEQKLLGQLYAGIHESALARVMNGDEPAGLEGVSEAVTAMNAIIAEKTGVTDAIVRREDPEYGAYYITSGVNVEVVPAHGPVPSSRIDALGAYLQQEPMEDVLGYLGTMQGANPRPYGRSQGFMAMHPAAVRILNRGRAGTVNTTAEPGHLSEAQVYAMLEDRLGPPDPIPHRREREREFMKQLASDMKINARSSTISKSIDRLAREPERLRALFVPEAPVGAPTAGLAPEGDIFPPAGGEVPAPPPADVVADAPAPVRPNPGIMPRTSAHLTEGITHHDAAVDTGKWNERKAAGELPFQRAPGGATETAAAPAPAPETTPLTTDDIAGEIEAAYQRLHDARLVRMDVPGTFVTRNSLARLGNRLTSAGIDLSIETLRGYIDHHLISRYEGSGGGMKARNDSTNRFELTAADVATAMVLAKHGERIPDALQNSLLAEAKRVRDELERQQKGRNVKVDRGNDGPTGGRGSEYVRVRRGNTAGSGRGRRNRS